VDSRRCPALLISAPGSSHGKTTVTAALARYHTEQGRKVRVFKAGPDFLDPMILEQACGYPVYQLDLWLAGENECCRMVYQAAQDADLILIEGVMGLFDGKPSSADLAELLGIPVLAVIDAKGVAQTLGAIATGLAQYRDGLLFAGVLANSIASSRHAQMVEEGLPEGIKYFGGIPHNQQFSLPERHLGLVQAEEVADIDHRLSDVASTIALTELATLPTATNFICSEKESLSQLLKGVRIGVARDAAFAFIYQANLDLLEKLGARLLFFSPLTDQTLPDVDSIYLPGGYPELFLEQLEQNQDVMIQIKTHFNLGKPIYAECGGMLYLFESLTDKYGNKASMVGLLPGQGLMQPSLKGLGYQSASLPGGVMRSHTFHHSLLDTSLTEIATGQRLFNTSPGEKIFQLERLIASYLHCYFPSNPVVTAQLFLP
jgi:cobyrinic acid a,c-diamide synthase